MSRYSDTKLFLNNTEYYMPLKKKRGVKNIVHHGTPVLKNPSVADRAMIASTSYIWKYGDRFYQVADAYYGVVRFWWVIAWFNGYPTEADIFPGDVITIPTNISEALRVLGVT